MPLQTSNFISLPFEHQPYALARWNHLHSFLLHFHISLCLEYPSIFFAHSSTVSGGVSSFPKYDCSFETGLSASIRIIMHIFMYFYYGIFIKYYNSMSVCLTQHRELHTGRNNVLHWYNDSNCH